MRELVFVDTESTGLDANEGNLIELSYAPLDGEIKTLWFGVESVTPFIDDLIKFTDRKIAGRQSTNQEIQDFLIYATDNTMVAANPSHDKAWLEAFGLWKFHYRMLDIESYAFGLLGFDEVPGMHGIFEKLQELGYELPEPDHSSAGDVYAMREIYKILQEVERDY